MRNEPRITYAEPGDLGFLADNDGHVSREVLGAKLERREVLVLWYGEQRRGLLRFGYFWDEIPFMNLLWVEKGLRGKGLGTQLVAFWEEKMRILGHETVMTSTLASERAQHLYRRLGYVDCGSLLMPDEPLEILLSKQLAP